MAIVTSMFWAPNTTEATPALRANLIGFRDVAREAGWTVDVVSLIPGGGGIQGEMGLLVEYPTLEEYAASLDREPDAKIVAHNAKLKSSDSRPIRSSSMMEMPGTETTRDDLPQRLINVSVIAPIPGKVPQALADVQKSREIMNGMGINVRCLQAFMADPAGIIVYGMYYESAAAWIEGASSLGQNEEWTAHFAKAPESRNIVRQSTWAIES